MTAASDPAWKDSPVSQWSEEDAKQFLADSPWVKKVQIDKVRDLSVFERRDGGNWEAGIPTGVGREVVGLFSDWKERAAVEHAFALAGLGSTMVRWESAPPVRAAEMKAGETGIPDWAGDYYAIAVYDIRPPFRWNLANQLKGLASLKRDKKKDLKPSRVVVLPRPEGRATFVYLFPRSFEVTRKDRVLGFTAQIGRMFVSTNFFPEEMRLQGQPQL